MPNIWQNGNTVIDTNPNDPSWKCWSVSESYKRRLMAGERPASWDMLLLPDRRQLYSLTRNTPVWFHASAHAPQNTQGLYVALTASSELNEASVLDDIFNLFYGILVELDAAGQPFPATMKTDIDNWLEQSSFAWRVADVEAAIAAASAT